MFLVMAVTGGGHDQTLLGYMYEHGCSGLKQDYSQAFHWYGLAADQGHSWGQKELAHLYLDGDGVKLNKLSAYFWLSLVLDSGDGDTYAQKTLRRIRLNKVDMTQVKKQLVRCRQQSGLNCSSILME